MFLFFLQFNHKINAYSGFLFLSVPIFKSFPEETLIKISDVLEETHYQPGDYIVSKFIFGCIKIQLTFKSEFLG